MKDINKYILEKLIIDDTVKPSEIDKVVNFCIDYFKENFSLKEGKQYTIKTEEKDNKIFIHFYFKLSNSAFDREYLKQLINSGTNICKKLEKETKYVYYYSGSIQEKRLTLCNRT